MEITPSVIREQQFSVKFRGFDIKEVDAFLEEMDASLTSLINKNQKLVAEIKRQDIVVADYKEKEILLKKSINSSQEIVGQIKANAEKSAEIIMEEAKLKASKILDRAEDRLLQIHKDIAGLKRKKMQIEIEIRSVLESHLKFLDASIEDAKQKHEEDLNIRLLGR